MKIKLKNHLIMLKEFKAIKNNLEGKLVRKHHLLNQNKNK